MGRNSVRPSTMPRISASSRSLIVLFQEAANRAPELRRVVGAIVPRARQLHPPFRPLPGVVKALRMDYGNDLVALGDQAQQRGGYARRVLRRLEAVLEQPAHRQIRIVVPAQL